MNQKGFSQVMLLGIIAVLVLTGAGGFLVLREKERSAFEETIRQMVQYNGPPEDAIRPIEPTTFFTEPTSPSRLRMQQSESRSAPQPSLPPQPQPSQTQQQIQVQPQIQPQQQQPPQYMTSPSSWFPSAGCKGDVVSFTHSPINPDIITAIIPLGRMNGDHITPTDHGYIRLSQTGTPYIPMADLKSPAEGLIVTIEAFPRPNDFRIVTWHSCTVSTIFIHVVELAPKITDITGVLPPGSRWFGSHNSFPIRVAAGQTIGKAGLSTDFSVHDTNVVLSGFVTPSLYNGEPWKIHTVDLFDYFAEPIRSQLRAKSERSVSPVGGKIDYDLDGRLVGNWFFEGTDYSGQGTSTCTYYECHLAIAYDHINPSLIRISIPNSGIPQDQCNVCFNVFGVKNNAPDPADVSVSTGLVKYELTGRDYYADKTLGLFLVQMLGDRRIKVELFLGKNAGEVSGFTNAARIYER